MAVQGRRKTVLVVLGGLLVTGGLPILSSQDHVPGVVYAAQGPWSTVSSVNKRPKFRPVDRSAGQTARQPGRWRPQGGRSVRPGQEAFAENPTRPWSWQPALNAPPAYGVGVSDLETARQQGLRFRPDGYSQAKLKRVLTRAPRPVATSATSSGFRPAKARPRYERLYEQARPSWDNSNLGSRYRYGMSPYYYTSSRLPR